MPHVTFNLPSINLRSNLVVEPPEAAKHISTPNACLKKALLFVDEVADTQLIRTRVSQFIAALQCEKYKVQEIHAVGYENSLFQFEVLEKGVKINFYNSLSRLIYAQSTTESVHQFDVLGETSSSDINMFCQKMKLDESQKVNVLVKPEARYIFVFNSFESKKMLSIDEFTVCAEPFVPCFAFCSHSFFSCKSLLNKMLKTDCQFVKRPQTTLKHVGQLPGESSSVAAQRATAGITAPSMSITDACSKDLLDRFEKICE